VREDEPSTDSFVEVRRMCDPSPQGLLDSVGLPDPLLIERFEHLVFLDETAAGLVVGLYPSPLTVLANDLAAPVLDFVDPYASGAGDDQVRVQAPGHQEAAYGDVLLGQLTGEVGDESRLADVSVASRRQGEAGAYY
jgi:hypothetical protein